MTDNPKFLHVAAHIFKDLLHAPMLVSGLYNWHRVFGGEFTYFEDKKETLNEYDIVMVGMNALDLNTQLISRIRDKIEGDTKLVVAIDYGVELWQGQVNPRHLASELKCADMVFAGESTIVNYLKAITDDSQPCYVMPHPTNIAALSVKRRSRDDCDNEIVAFIHMYDNNWYSPWIVTHDLPYKVVANIMNHNIENLVRGWFEHYRLGTNWEAYQDWVATKAVIYDSYQRIHSYGRQSVEAAVLEIPVVGSTWVESQRYLWPDLTTDPDDVWKQRKLIKRVMTDHAFRDDCIAHAVQRVMRYDYGQRKTHFLECLDDATKTSAVHRKRRIQFVPRPAEVVDGRRHEDDNEGADDIRHGIGIASSDIG